MRLIKWFLIFAICLTLVGCASQPDVPGLEKDILSAYNEDLTRKGSTVLAKSVSLVQETDTKFTGFAEMTNGTRISMEVTWSGYKAIYKAGF